MAFKWTDKPNPPSTDLPVPVPATEISYKVKAVANTVDYGGTVRYNTANKSYDVVYEFPTLNVVQGEFENGFFESANVKLAFFNVATINVATINTASITNATITLAYATGDPTTNAGIATKQYVDNAIANISHGTGPDSTANLFISRGDLLVGFAPNTAHRLGNGTDGQVLTVDASSNIAVSWKGQAGSQRAVGLFIGTHTDPNKKFTQVLLKRADGIFMNDGEYVANWTNVIADMSVSGAGGRDAVSAEAPNTWYEVYAIRNSSTDQRALLLHRMIDRADDANWPALAGEFAYLRRGDLTLTIPDMRYITKVSQSFVVGIPGRVASVDLQLTKIGSPSGNMWVTIQNESGDGNADGGILCTSERLQVQDLSSSETRVRFVFDTAATLSSGRYHVVAEGDFGTAVADTVNSIGIRGNTPTLGPGQQVWMANVGYTNGNLTINSGYGDCRIWNVVTSTWKVAANAQGVGHGPQDIFFLVKMEENRTNLVLPSGYDQYCLISYCDNNGSSNLKEYTQHNRTMCLGYDPDWLTFTSATSGLQPLELASCVPPIPCSIQLLVHNVDTSFETPLAHRFTFDLPFGSNPPDVVNRGMFYYSQSGARMGYTAFVAQDEWNFIHVKPIFSTNIMSIYVSSIVF